MYGCWQWLDALQLRLTILTLLHPFGLVSLREPWTVQPRLLAGEVPIQRLISTMVRECEQVSTGRPSYQFLSPPLERCVTPEFNSQAHWLLSCLTNFETPQVYVSKSPAYHTAGGLRVRLRPRAITTAACVHRSSASGSTLSLLRSASAMICLMAAAQRL